MKRSLILLTTLLTICTFLSSCYTYNATVGSGAKQNVQVKKKNHYVIFGLAPVGTSDAKEMAGGATDYNVTVTHTFIDGLLSGITFGIYTPTTTIVTK
ncbi:Bor family protein [Arcticibacter sp. MXS-1]|uniref:Bor family protein n=1 Tax=Arcticibacter sp. MXS-1 TaxID=3341726 RepID=UPI0035A8AD40